MFAYGLPSDLKNGGIVTPIRKSGDRMYCVDLDGNECWHSFDDFDFDKTEEERAADRVPLRTDAIRLELSPGMPEADLRMVLPVRVLDLDAGSWDVRVIADPPVLDVMEPVPLQRLVSEGFEIGFSESRADLAVIVPEDLPGNMLSDGISVDIEVSEPKLGLFRQSEPPQELKDMTEALWRLGFEAVDPRNARAWYIGRVADLRRNS